jgi:hypothetical protein
MDVTQFIWGSTISTSGAPETTNHKPHTVVRLAAKAAPKERSHPLGVFHVLRVAGIPATKKHDLTEIFPVL